MKKLKVEGIEVQRIANGEISIKTLIRIYLIEYIKIKFKNPTDTTVLIIPSIEKIVWWFSSADTTKFKVLIRFEKHILVFKKLLPISLIADEIRLFKLMICSHIKKLLFIQIPTKIIFMKNWYGFWDEVIEKLESKCLIVKYRIKPISKLFAINKIPEEDDEPSNFSRYVESIILVLINVILSKAE